MNANAVLQHDVEQELRWDPKLQAEHVGVTVFGDVVQLDGQVGSLWEKWAAEDATLRVKNVKAVANELKVDWPSANRCADADIAQAASNQLEWNFSVPKTVKVKVSNATIRLEGTVEAQYQKCEAERSLRSLRGVIEIINEITVQPKAMANAVQTNISDAFKRSAAIDAKNIQIEALDGRVTLRGQVRTWAERDEAQRTAWSAPGVNYVDDLLTVNWV